ncbi:MAG: penicillin-insensitive murein endopeptidase [Pseudomonadota bacterium]
MLTTRLLGIDAAAWACAADNGRRRGRLLATVLLAGVLGAMAAAHPSPALAEQARYLFGAKRNAAGDTAAPIGSYAAGCLSGGEALAETGPGWQAMRLSRNRNWGHPSMIEFIQRLSGRAQSIGWPGIYVGDISQPRGGPMLSGHASHQIGLDADIWLRRPAETPLSRGERERIGSVDVVAADGRTVSSYFSDEHRALIRAASEDDAVARIFVHAAIKQNMCDAAPAGDRAWLRKVRPWFGHDAHFHVRLSCPAGGTAFCVDQPPPPPGDGCGAELASWFQPPDPNAKPARRTGPPRGRYIALADLPGACAALVR